MKLLIEKIKRKKSELEVKETSKVFSSSNKDSKNKLKDTKETSFMKQKKLNYEKFIFKKDDIPQLFKSFIIHFLYTYKKLLRGKVF